MERRYPVMLFVCLLAIACAVTSGCDSKKQAAQPGAAQSDGKEPLKIDFSGGAASGTWFMCANGVSECINKSYPGSIVTIVPGTGAANIARTHRGEVDLAMAVSTTSVLSMSAQGGFSEEMTNIAAVASLYASYVQIVVDAKLGVTTMDEIIDNKVKIRFSLDQAGSGSEVAFRYMLGGYGVTVEQMENWGCRFVNRDRPDSNAMFADNMIDGFVAISLYPETNIQETATRKKIAILSIKPAVVDKMVQYGYSRDIIPANAYAFNETPINTFGSHGIVIIAKDAPEALGYKTARALVENLAYLRSIHASLKDLTPEKLCADTGVPLHKGAEKYYREIGIIH